MVVLGIVTASVALSTPLLATARSGDDASAVALANASRRSAGLQTLRRAGVLDALAARHNSRMASSGTIFHNEALPSQLTATGADWVVAGENVGVGPSVRNIHDAFMASAAHRPNVLSSGYNAVGIAVTSGADGRVYVTQVFAELGSARSSTGPVPAVHGACALRTAEDGTTVPASFYGLPC